MSGYLAAAGLIAQMAGGIMSGVGDMTQARRIKATGQNWLDEGKTNLEDSQAKAVGANLAAMPQIGNLTRAANELSQSEHTKMITAAMGDYWKIRDQQKAIMDKMYDPAKLAEETRRFTATKAVAGGTKGSPFSEAMFARQYGRDTTDVLGKKLSALEDYMRSSYAIQKAPEYDFFSQSFITPMQKYQTDVEQRLLEAQMRLLASGSKWQGIGKMVSGIGGSLMGAGMMGGGGGGGGGGIMGMFGGGGSASTAGTGGAFH